MFVPSYLSLRRYDEGHFRMPRALLAAVNSRPPPFKHIKRSIYRTAGVKHQNEDDGVCGCTGGVCGDACVNRALKIECIGAGSSGGAKNKSKNKTAKVKVKKGGKFDNCSCGPECGNRRFARKDFAKVVPFRTPGRGWGLRMGNQLSKEDALSNVQLEREQAERREERVEEAAAKAAKMEEKEPGSTSDSIAAAAAAARAKAEEEEKENGTKGLKFAGLRAGSFVMEYVGEVVDDKEARRRLQQAADDGEAHVYMMEIRDGEVIDARNYGNNARFINHSCDPNCHLQKWRVGDRTRIGIFALRDIEENEELTYDYQMFTSDANFRCLCGTKKCRGTLASVSLKSQNEKKMKTYTAKRAELRRKVENEGFRMPRKEIAALRREREKMLSTFAALRVARKRAAAARLSHTSSMLPGTFARLEADEEAAVTAALSSGVTEAEKKKKKKNKGKKTTGVAVKEVGSKSVAKMVRDPLTQADMAELRFLSSEYRCVNFNRCVSVVTCRL